MHPLCRLAPSRSSCTMRPMAKPGPHDDDRARAVLEEIERIRSRSVVPTRTVSKDGPPSAEVRQVVDTIERRRALAARRQRDLSIAGAIDGIRRKSKQANRRLGELVSLWEELLPSDFVAQTRMTSLRGGVLRVTVASSAIGYELDRRLREGLLADLRSRFGGTLARVTVRVGNVRGDRE